MASPTPTEVKVVFSTTRPDAEIEVFIADALLIAANCAEYNNLSADAQKSVVRWLTAHLLSSENSGAVSSKALGDASTSWAAPALGVGLRSTTYGQRALLIAPTLERSSSMRPTFFAV